MHLLWANDASVTYFQVDILEEYTAREKHHKAFLRLYPRTRRRRTHLADDWASLSPTRIEECTQKGTNHRAYTRPAFPHLVLRSLRYSLKAYRCPRLQSAGQRRKQLHCHADRSKTSRERLLGPSHCTIYRKEGSDGPVFQGSWIQL